jgi:hypothetical protein
MNDDSPEAKTARLLQLSKEVKRIAGSLAQLSIGPAPPPLQGQRCCNANEPDLLSERIARLIRARRYRLRYVDPELLGEPAWDMLLELLRAEVAHDQISVSSACAAAGVAPSTGLRWLKALEDRGMVIWQSDALDSELAFVALSPRASAFLRRYFLEVFGAPGSNGP